MNLLSLLDNLPPGVGIMVTPYARSAVLRVPLFQTRIPAGFPSPADDYLDSCLDLNDLVVKHPAATFFVRVDGNSMVEAGIDSGDVLVVDRALQPGEDAIVVAVVNGDFTVKRIHRVDGRLFLAPANLSCDPIEITEEVDFTVWGVVTYVIHRVQKGY